MRLMEDVLIIKNIEREGPGYFKDLLKKFGVSYKIIEFGNGEEPPNHRDYKAVIVLGGPDSANDETKKTIEELYFIKNIIEDKVPYLGICLGMQLLVKATEGKVVKAHEKEIGFKVNENVNYSVEIKDDCLDDPIFVDVDKSFNVFQLHGETVEPKNNIKILLLDF